MKGSRASRADVNIKGTWNTVRAVLPTMVEAGGGSVVITSSVTGDIVADPAGYAVVTVTWAQARCARAGRGCPRAGETSGEAPAHSARRLADEAF